jgi:hypothetical protein
MARKEILFSRLWLSSEAQENLASLANHAGIDWPPGGTVEIQPSTIIDGGLFVFVGSARCQIKPGHWKLDH